MDKLQAIISLVPGAKVNILNDNVEWVEPSVAPVTDEEIEIERLRLVQEYQSNQYQRDRKFEYPTISEQLDMLWHAIDLGKLNKTSDFYTTLKSVKDKYPKSE